MNYLAFVGSEIITAMKDFFSEVGKEIAQLWFWPAIFIGVMILAIIAMILLVRFSYENRILKSVNRLNKYFLQKPYINEENLVEFNLKMKAVPEVLRSNWQVYMLNREDPLSTYININSCIDKPLRTSSIEKNMGNFTIFSVLLGLLSFAIGLVYATHVAGTNILGDVMFLALLVPLAVTILYTIFYLVIKASKNDIYACLYENFPLYERNLTKAVTTLPAYVDYEILFTKKEIKDGIPILQQYLEKRAKVEEEELERARENAMIIEEYDFSELGVDGSLVLERAMKESETFIKIRRRLQDESNAIETEKDNYKKTFEQTLKDMQRKLQASRENLENLKKEQEASTNRIESNYIRKQQSDEIKKQEQLEKDIEQATAKFHEEQDTLQREIEKRDKEIEEKKEFVEQAMLLEFKHYANTLYQALTGKAKEVANQKLVSLAQENADLKALLTDIHGVGVDESELDYEGNLIQPNEITTDNLYEMSGSDESQLEETRVASKQMEAEENKKIKEKNKEKKAAEKALAQTAQEPARKPTVKPEEEPAEAQKEQPAKEPSQVADEIETEVEEKMPKQEPAKKEEMKDEDDEIPEVNKEKDSDDFDKIQREIEEENSRLKHEKMELENDLNKTISKFDTEYDEDEIPPRPVVKKPKYDDDEDEVKPTKKSRFESELEDIRPSRKSSFVDDEDEIPQRPVVKKSRYDDDEDDGIAVKKSPRRDIFRELEETGNEEDSREEEVTKPARRATVKRSTSKEKERKPRATSRRSGVSRRPSREEDDSASGLESLHAEMQKILTGSRRR